MRMIAQAAKLMMLVGLGWVVYLGTAVALMVQGFESWERILILVATATLAWSFAVAIRRLERRQPFRSQLLRRIFGNVWLTQLLGLVGVGCFWLVLVPLLAPVMR